MTRYDGPDGAKRLELLEELALASAGYLVCNCPIHHQNLVGASTAIDRDNERLDRLEQEYEDSVKRYHQIINRVSPSSRK